MSVFLYTVVAIPTALLFFTALIGATQIAFEIRDLFFKRSMEFVEETEDGDVSYFWSWPNDRWRIIKFVIQKTTVIIILLGASAFMIGKIIL